MLYDKCLEMSYKNSLTSDQNIVPSCAIVPNIDRQSKATSVISGKFRICRTYPWVGFEIHEYSRFSARVDCLLAWAQIPAGKF